MQDQNKNPGGKNNGKSKRIFKTCHFKKYFEICHTDHSHDGLYVFLHDGGWFVCVKFDRNKRTFRDQPDCTHHSACHSSLYHACHRGQRGDYEKDGGAEK